MNMTSSVRSSTLPPVDARLVAPESGYEVVDGRVVKVTPSDGPHGIRHSKISALLEAYAREGYEVASDMLTRLTEVDDMAPDVSVFPAAHDPITGGRQIEELAFEVVNTERLSKAGAKAAKLVARGVRRVFAIDVVRQRAFEWSTELDAWAICSDSSNIEDRALVMPLPIEALVRAAKTDDAIARALLSKGNPVLRTALAQSKLEGKAEALLAILQARGLSASAAERNRILRSRSEAELDAWLVCAFSCSSIAELLRANEHPSDS
jgi:Uma2 family endonuclease